MTADRRSLNASRRSLAIAVWSLLLAFIALTPSEITSVNAVFLLFAASAFSAVPLMLVSREWSEDNHPTATFEQVSLAIAFAIPLTWSAHFAQGNDPLSIIMFSAIAVVPVALMWVVLKSRLPSNKSASAADQAIVSSPVETPSPLESDANEVFVETASDPVDEEETSEELDSDLETMSFDESSFDRDGPENSDVTQWLTRSLTVEGEIVEGGVRIEFADGQREATVHLSFCPALGGVPEMTTEDLDGVDLEIRVSAAFPFGARMTIRRPGNGAKNGDRIPAMTCRIGFVAVVPAVRRAA